jgi:hypothetical protein
MPVQAVGLDARHFRVPAVAIDQLTMAAFFHDNSVADDDNPVNNITYCRQPVRDNHGGTPASHGRRLRRMRPSVSESSWLVNSSSTTTLRSFPSHRADFSKYSWIGVHASDLWPDRIMQAVDSELQSKGWMKVPSGGDAAVAAVEKVTEQAANLYDGYPGSRWGGFGEATTPTIPQKVGNPDCRYL